MQGTGTLSVGCRRDSRRYYDDALAATLERIAAEAGRVRDLLDDLRGEAFYDDTDDTRARLREARTELDRAAGSVERAREQLPPAVRAGHWADAA